MSREPLGASNLPIEALIGGFGVDEFVSVLVAVLEALESDLKVAAKSYEVEYRRGIFASRGSHHSRWEPAELIR